MSDVIQLIISTRQSLEETIRDTVKASDEKSAEHFRGIENRLSGVEKQVKITNGTVTDLSGRVTTLEQDGITNKAIKNALNEVHETNEAVKMSRWSLRSNKVQFIAGIVTVAILVFGDLWYHHF